MNAILFSENELSQTAQRVLEGADSKILLFKGLMGVGKTTLIKEICKQLGVKEKISSPTFSIVNEYEFPNGLIFHFDFYRIKSIGEAFDLGFEDYLYSGHFLFIEWPEKVASLLPKETTTIELTVLSDGKRSLTIS